MDLETLSAKLGCTKMELYPIVKSMVVDIIRQEAKYYEDDASSTEMIKYLDAYFQEDELFEKLSEKLECIKE